MHPPVRSPLDELGLSLTRRRFLARGSHLLGGAALATLLAEHGHAAATPSAAGVDRVAEAIGPHFAPRAKHVIYLHMVGGPPQQDMFDYKPKMDEWYDKDLPESIRNGQRLTTMTSGQSRFPIAPSKFKFAQHGQCGMWVTELLPHTAKMVDDMCFIRSMHTEAINHEPAITYMQTGNQIAGRPCLGAWLSYGLVQDLKARGLLDETLIIWGGEFGRTVYSQGGLSKENYGRDHHPRCFTMWMAGGGSRPGQIYGATDDFSYNIVKDPVHIRDFHATVLHLMGFDHERLTYRHLGLDFRLTGVEPARVIHELMV